MTKARKHEKDGLVRRRNGFEFYLQPRKPDYAALDHEAAALVEGKKITVNRRRTQNSKSEFQKCVVSSLGKNSNARKKR